MQFSLVAGKIPPGTRLFTQGVSSGGITGTPTTEGLIYFTIRVKDQTGGTDTEAFYHPHQPTATAGHHEPDDTLSPGMVGSSTAARTCWPTVRS